MIWNRFKFNEIYLYQKPVDMRKGIDGLGSIVAKEMLLDPGIPNLYLFTNRSRDKLKILLWENNGFWVLYKRLQKQRFHWPDWFTDNKITLNQEHCDYLLQGINLNGLKPHEKIFAAHHF